MLLGATGRSRALTASVMAIPILVPAPARPFAAALPAATQHTYAEASGDVLNPERGFFYPDDAIAQADLKDVRRLRNASVIRTLYALDAYRNAPLPPAFLQKVEQDLAWVRGAGLKAIVRFAYSADIGQPDAPLDRVLSHIDQLAPILTADADVIVMLEAGFIGAWGEWHSSTNGLETDASRKAVLTRLLSALPAGRMVAVRRDVYKRGALGSDKPLAPDEAFDGSPRARVGAHNDCLGASADDFGTYSEGSVESEKAFLGLDNRFVPQTGETCNPGPFAQCAGMLQDLRRMRWDLLNQGYHPDVLAGWKQQGCFPEIQAKLGYRFVLLRAAIQDSVRPGGGLHVSLSLANEGWGKAFNPRGLELVLREERSHARYVLPLADDPRRWGPGDTAAVEVTGGIPSGMPAGAYRLFLNLPDPMPRLRGRPEYSIRLANTGLWEDSTGLNALQHTVIVSPSAGGPAFAGAAFAPAGGQTVSLGEAGPAGARRKIAWMRKAFDVRGRTLGPERKAR